MDWNGQKFLDQFIDQGMDIDITWEPAREIPIQVERLAREVALMELVRDHPGRLPETSGREARKSDKKYARQAHSRMATWLRFWIKQGQALGVPNENQTAEEIMAEMITKYKKEPEVKVMAAQLKWPQWWQSHRTDLTNIMRRVATHAKERGPRKEGNKMLNRLANEWSTLDDVFGNLQTSDLE